MNGGNEGQRQGAARQSRQSAQALSRACGRQAGAKDGNEQALVSIKLKKSVDAEGGGTFAVIIEGG